MVGKKYPEFVGRDVTIFDVTDGGAILYVGLPFIRDEEVEEFGKGDIEVRFCVIRKEIFLTVKMGKKMTLDAPYNPYLSIYLTELPEILDGFGMACTINIFDSISGEVKALRKFTLSTEFSRRFICECKEILSKPFDFTQHDRNVSQVLSSYTTKQLAKMAFARDVIRKECKTT